MSEPIKVGDLVMVVRGHSCVLARLGGVPFRVTEIMSQHVGGWFCSACNTPDIAPNEMVGARLSIHFHKNRGLPLIWLKKIPPLSELEGEQRDERIEA